MFGLGMQELLIILVILLFVFGPGKIPQVGASLGQTIRGFKKAMEEPKLIPPKEEEKKEA